METGFISTLQPYSTKDGPGIRTTVFCIGCNLRCVWCANPELMLPDEKYMYFKQRCIKCGTCKGSITLDERTELCPKSAYEKIGFHISSKELATKLLRDKAFYIASGGGVTFSGGEAALQANFVRETAKLLRQEGVSVALDTAGHIHWSTLHNLLEEIDLVLYDLKAIDPSIHKHCTNMDNALILENLKKIASIHKPLWIRMVLVPSWNDDLDDIRKRFEFIKSLGDVVQRIDILKYHNLGAGKYHCLGIDNPIHQNLKCSDSFIRKVQQLANDLKLDIKIDN